MMKHLEGERPASRFYKFNPSHEPDQPSNQP